MINKNLTDRIEYLVTCISAFAEKYNLTNTEAYGYLRRFTGIDFLIDCYESEHTLSVEDAVSDLQLICARHGGKIA